MDDCAEMSKWDPMAEDYHSVMFNSYDSGPGALLPLEMCASYKHTNGQRTDNGKGIKLFIPKVPLELTEFGLKNYLTGVGCEPIHVQIVSNPKVKHSAIAFIDFANLKTASKALELIHKRPPFNFNVSFAVGQSAVEKKQKVIEEEYSIARIKRIESAKMALANGNASQMHNFSPISRSVHENGNGDSCLDDLSQLANSDKLLKVLPNSSTDCSFCIESPKLEHLHFIVSEKRIIDPMVKLPQLMDIVPYSCDNCGKDGSGLKLCGNCQNACYCSVRCQLLCWNDHAKKCNGDSESSLSADSSVSVSQIPKQSLNNGPHQSTPIINVPSHVSAETGKISKVNSGDCVTPKANDEMVNAKALVKSQSIEKKKDESPIKAQTQKSVHSVTLTESPQKLNVNEQFGIIVGEPLNLNVFEKASMSFGRDPSDFYVVKDAKKRNLAHLSNQLNEECAKSNLPSIDNLKIGDFCAGVYDDGEWYRAVVKGKDHDKYYLKFIDYGNTELVSSENIKQLPHKYYKAPAQGIHCTITGIKPIDGDQWSDDAIAYFAQLCDGTTFFCRFIQQNKDGPHSVQLKLDDDTDFATLMINKNYARYANDEKNEEKTQSVTIDLSSLRINPNKSPFDALRQPMTNVTTKKDEEKVTHKVIEKIPPKEPDTQKSDIIIKLCPNNASNNAQNTKVISLIDTLKSESRLNDGLFSDAKPFNVEKGQYWVFIDIVKYGQLFAKVQEQYKKSKPSPLKSEATIGQYVVIKASDEAFYRAIIYEVFPDKSVNALMIDSGYIEKVANDEIYELISELYDDPSFASLVFPMDSSEMKKLNDMYSNSDELVFSASIKSQSNGEALAIVEISNNIANHTMTMKFLSHDAALKEISPSKSEESIDYIKDLPFIKMTKGITMEALVLHHDVKHPKIFYIAGDGDVLQNIMSEAADLGAAYNGSYIEPKNGNTYLVKGPDNDWYRAMVLEKPKENKCKVYFIDFGNDDYVEAHHIIELPKRLKPAVKPAIAIKCVIKSSEIKDNDISGKIQGAADGSYMLNIEVLDYNNGICDVKLMSN